MLIRKILPLFILFSLSLSAQESTIDQQLIWMGATITGELQNDYSLSLSVDERRFAFPDGRQQRVLPDIFGTKSLPGNWSITAGLWFFQINQPQTPFVESQGQVKELRPYFAVKKNIPLSEKSAVSLQLKSEYRLFRTVDAANHFNGPILREDARERLKIAYSYKIAPKTTLSVADELHMNFWSSDEQQGFFQQNRVMASLKRNFGRGFSGSLGYIWWFQPTGAENQYFSRQIINFQVAYRFKLYSEGD